MIGDPRPLVMGIMWAVGLLVSVTGAVPGRSETPGTARPPSRRRVQAAAVTAGVLATPLTLAAVFRSPAAPQPGAVAVVCAGLCAAATPPIGVSLLRQGAAGAWIAAAPFLMIPVAGAVAALTTLSGHPLADAAVLTFVCATTAGGLATAGYAATAGRPWSCLMTIHALLHIVGWGILAETAALGPAGFSPWWTGPEGQQKICQDGATDAVGAAVFWTGLLATLVPNVHRRARRWWPVALAVPPAVALVAVLVARTTVDCLPR